MDTMRRLLVRAISWLAVNPLLGAVACTSYPAACLESGDAESCHRAGEDAHSFDKSVDFFERACRAGRLDDCDTAGRLYAEAQAGGKNLEKARELLTLSCGTKVDVCEALANFEERWGDTNRWAAIAANRCRSGQFTDCLGLATAFSETPEGVEYSILACTKVPGADAACSFLARQCMEGFPGACDGVRGLWPGLMRTRVADEFRSACEQGEVQHCVLLGWMHENNPEMVDLEEATRLYSAACEGGVAEGCVRLEKACARRRSKRCDRFGHPANPN
jgi:TPR repeat protein